jgi:N-acyl-D-aspartate/D-glutamate deacylase
VLNRYVKKRGVISWEEAIYKMSGHPAEKFKIQKRGLIIKDYFADITILDPLEISDNATFENPYQYPTGIDYVFVNGKIVLDKGAHTGQRAGKVIRRKAALFEF